MENVIKNIGGKSTQKLINSIAKRQMFFSCIGKELPFIRRPSKGDLKSG